MSKRGVNKSTLVGNLGNDPDVRNMPGGGVVTNINVATTEIYKDKNGNKKEDTEWHRVVFFGKLAEIAGEYLKKGNQVYVEGKMKTKKWTDKDGVDRYTTEVVGHEMQKLSGGSTGKQYHPPTPAEPRGEGQHQSAPAAKSQMMNGTPSNEFQDMDDLGF